MLWTDSSFGPSAMAQLQLYTGGGERERPAESEHGGLLGWDYVASGVVRVKQSDVACDFWGYSDRLLAVVGACGATRSAGVDPLQMRRRREQSRNRQQQTSRKVWRFAARSLSARSAG